ncbi:MAG TPA: AAA family ATPase [Candidatus Saccharimonadales bacterium]|jgi:chromosome segregation protein|nr:AAA family ATPase [Candidatus Saccharimonadales bacterium]
MVIKDIEIAGFRGVRGIIKIPFGPSFTVITGRNGAGKSTICDAIEYAMTGEISRLAVTDPEKGERISDYIWWRGLGEPLSKRVAVRFANSGEPFTQEATPDSRSEVDVSLFCAPDSGSDPIRKLCQTSIFRDELISRLSTDLSESERFEFVKRALGLAEFADIERKCAALEKDLKSTYTNVERLYTSARERVAAYTTQISEARTLATRASDVQLDHISLAVAGYLTVVPPQGSLSALSVQVRRALGEHRNRTQRLEILSLEVKNSQAQQTRRADLQSRIDDLREQLGKAESRLRSAETIWESEKRGINDLRAESPRNAALALLAQTGSQLGTIEEKCPLCGLTISEKDFRSHLKEIQTAVHLLDQRIGDATARFTSAQAERATATSEYERLSSEASRITSEIQAVDLGLVRLRDQAALLGVELALEKIDTELARSRTAVEALDGSVTQIDSLLALEQITDLEQQLSLGKLEAEKLGAEMDRISTARQNAKAISTSARRVSAENMDERLASLSPLLTELYVRLRPHVDFVDVSYRMRGDVKRFLSLQVGHEEALNPRFIFSSGQRRALGLAFLLAVHLSRPWCKLNSLILDDPVQHVDDYRALHLVEVLAAIRQRGEQIICTAEDPDLAELLCRRLRSESGSEGMMVELSYVANMGVTVSKIKEITPFPKTLLMSAKVKQERLELGSGA